MKSMLNQKEKILLYGGNIWSFGAGMFGPLLAIFTEKVGGSILDVAWAWAIFLIISGILYINAGKISDHRIKKEDLMVLGYALNALFTFSYLLVQKPMHLFIVQAGLGIASALASPTWMALYSKYEDKKHAGFAWGMAGGESAIFTGIAVIIGGLIVKYFSFDILFITMGVIQLIATVYQAKILRYH